MDHYDMEEGHLMKKLFAIMTAVLLFAAGAALAQEQKPVDKNEGFSEWLKALQRKIETMTAKKSIPMSTGVAGIRGAKEDEKAKLYWKGKKGGEGVTEEELTEFKSDIYALLLLLLLLLLRSRFSRVRVCVTPWTAAHQAPQSLGFSRQEHWSGLPCPPPMHESEM